MLALQVQQEETKNCLWIFLYSEAIHVMAAIQFDPQQLFCMVDVAHSVHAARPRASTAKFFHETV